MPNGPLPLSGLTTKKTLSHQLNRATFSFTYFLLISYNLTKYKRANYKEIIEFSGILVFLFRKNSKNREKRYLENGH